MGPAGLSKRERVREYLREQADASGFFFKSKFIADDLDLSSSQIGTIVRQLQERDNGLDIEQWSYTNATTWRVEPTDG